MPPLTAKNLPKIGGKEEKSGRKGKNWEGSFTLPLLTDRAGYATDCKPLWMSTLSKMTGNFKILAKALPVGHEAVKLHAQTTKIKSINGSVYELKFCQNSYINHIKIIFHSRDQTM